MEARENQSRRCCTTLNEREVYFDSESKSYVDEWKCFVNRRLNRYHVAVYTLLGMVLILGWVLALLLTGIETQSQFQQYKDHKCEEIRVLSAKFNQTCMALSCRKQCLDAISANLPVVKLCSDGVDCGDVPKYRYGWLTLIIVLCILVPFPCEIVIRLIAVYRHCKYY